MDTATIDAISKFFDVGLTGVICVVLFFILKYFFTQNEKRVENIVSEAKVDRTEFKEHLKSANVKQTEILETVAEALNKNSEAFIKNADANSKLLLVLDQKLSKN